MTILPIPQVPRMMWSSPDGCCTCSGNHALNSNLLSRAINLPELCRRGTKALKAVCYPLIFDNMVSASYLKIGQKWQRTMENYLSTLTPLKIFFPSGLLPLLVCNFQPIIRKRFFCQKDSESQRDKHMTPLVRVTFFRFTKDFLIKGIKGVFIASEYGYIF